MKNLTLLKSLTLVLMLSFSALNAIADENTKPMNQDKAINLAIF